VAIGIGVGEDVGDLLAVRQRLHVGLTIGERVGVTAGRLGDHQRAVGADLGDRRAVVGPAAQRRYGVGVYAVDVGVVGQHVAVDRIGQRVLGCRGDVCHRHRRVVAAGDGHRQGRCVRAAVAIGIGVGEDVADCWPFASACTLAWPFASV
jgi:hypothetical protein